MSAFVASLRPGELLREPARVGRWLLALSVVASAIALGSVHTTVLALVAATAALATGLLWFDGPPMEPRPAATMIVATALLLNLHTALQLVPLPHGLLAVLAPENADVWSRALTPLHEAGPSWAPLSLDPTATRVQLLRGVTYLVVFAGALRVAQRPEGLAFLERTLVISAVVIGAAALVHPVLGARKVFGLYEPKEWLAYDVAHLGPILNTNHLAAYLNMALAVAFASVIEKREAIPRPVALVVVLLLGATTVWTLSRGGTAAMVLGALLTALLAFGSRRSRRTSIVAPLAGAIVAIGGATVLFLAAFDDSRGKFARNDLSKLQLIKNALGMLREHPLFGVGRGAFESVFPKSRVGTEYFVYTNPENVIAQWLTEWGIPVSIAAMAMLVWALRPRTALSRSRVPAGAWAALVATLAHNLVDYNSELPGMMIAMSVCAAMVTGGTGGGQQTKPRWAFWAKRPRVLAVSLAAVTVVMIAVTVPFASLELYNEQRAFRELGLDRSLSRATFHDRAREAMLRHPAEPYFPFVGAVRATVVRDESVLPWAARALERSPVYGRVHLLLARSLYVRNPSQARLEYRIACTQDSGTCTTEEAALLVHDYDEAMELVPDGQAGLGVLFYLTTKLAERLPSTVVRLDRVIVERDPGALAPALRAGSAALKDVQNGEAWCDEGSRASCLADGLAAAQRLRVATPDKCDGHALHADLRVAAGEVDAGFAELDAALDQVTDRSACGRRLVSLAVQTHNNARVDTALDRLLKLGCEAPAECVTNFTFAADIESQRGSSRRALALKKKAWERAPERDDLLIAIAQMAEAQGFHGEALEAYTKLSERHPEDKRWSEGATRERLAATRGVFERR